MIEIDLLEENSIDIKYFNEKSYISCFKIFEASNYLNNYFYLNFAAKSGSNYPMVLQL